MINGQVVVRGNRRNYDRWAEEGAEGWSYDDVLPYFKKMEDNRDPEYVANGTVSSLLKFLLICDKSIYQMFFVKERIFANRSVKYLETAFFLSNTLF